MLRYLTSRGAALSLSFVLLVLSENPVTDADCCTSDNRYCHTTQHVCVSQCFVPFLISRQHFKAFFFNIEPNSTDFNNRNVEFYFLLAVHLITVLVNNQLDAQYLFLMFVYSNFLHVSSNQVLIIRRVSCINTTSGICHCM